MTVGAWLAEADRRLGAAGIESARLEATVIAAHVWGLTRSQVLARSADPAPAISEAEALVERRLRREPLAYLVGHREFYRREFLVGPGVLIPRQDTEVLVEAAIEIAPAGARVADLGTGSGCIGITLALERPDLKLTLIDLSLEALRFARDNASRLGADVEILEGDGIEFLERGYDLVVTNPPYVADGDSLPREVAVHEPALALFAGVDGMNFYRRLAASVAPWVLTEIGDGQAANVKRVFADAGWMLRMTRNDLSRTPRVLEFRRLGLTT